MTKFIRKTLCIESKLITMTRLYLSLQTKEKHTAVRLQAVSKDEILYAYDKTKKNENSFKSQTSGNTKDIFVCSRHKTQLNGSRDSNQDQNYIFIAFLECWDG